ncbi:hypothetical protein HDU93_002521 [Gonapodya sp. JEL0774]|nr:hypothetical protein HDU93_002521 [Gonapodya sp. JEL0774]
MKLARALCYILFPSTESANVVFYQKPPFSLLLFSLQNKATTVLFSVMSNIRENPSSHLSHLSSKGKRPHGSRRYPDEVDLSDQPFASRMSLNDLGSGSVDADLLPLPATSAPSGSAMSAKRRESWWEWMWGTSGASSHIPAAPPTQSAADASESPPESWSEYAERLVLDGMEVAAENLEHYLGYESIPLDSVGHYVDENGVVYIEETEEQEELRQQMEKARRDVHDSLTREILIAGGLIGANIGGYF